MQDKTSIVFMFISSFMALFPVANPIGAGFILNGILSDLDPQQRRSIIRRIAVDYLLVGIGCLAIGHLVLSLFDLSLPIVQLGGGLLICKTALQWLADTGSPLGAPLGKTADPPSKQRAIESQIFYPMTFPISIGPGSISVIFTLMASASVKGELGRSVLNYTIIAFVIALLAGMLYLILSQGQKIMKKIGGTVSLIINKMVAFFTFCVGIQIVVAGIAKIFHLNLL